MGDDFSAATTRALGLRVQHVCSNPGCRASTSGPRVDPTKAINLGVAAHLTAASEGGPRYDPSLTHEQRSSIENGIWLCQNCAKLVDTDTIKFTVRLLHKWKADSEYEAEERLGKTPVAAPAVGEGFELKAGMHVRIEPIVPEDVPSNDWLVIENSSDHLKLQSQMGYQTVIPKTMIEAIHPFIAPDLPMVEVRGRLQFVSMAGQWRIFRHPPQFRYGTPKKVDAQYPIEKFVFAKFPMNAWHYEQHIHRWIQAGWKLFYDEDGSYLTKEFGSNTEVLMYRY
jgi:hypothetical protein